MNPSARINIADVVDNSRIGGFQIGIFVLCAACLIMDGFDVQAVGYVAPEIRASSSSPRPRSARSPAPVSIGILVGAFLFSIFGDTRGRRPVLIVATLCFSALTIATGLATSLTQLVMLRFLAGIGLGGIMPNIVALVSEYSPRRSRVFVMMLIHERLQHRRDARRLRGAVTGTRVRLALGLLLRRHRPARHRLR